ncbi:CRISPR-associated endonuclease/helicase Cas3 [Pelotomaculum schinkii]|uniref:CRISPR-associated endonuclease/helicase Cas3 n=1 Tax=Pelotomaculum schinkii TaxID=78350 RepID=A0A4Y7RAH2_9FIRM|nr:CRISPR-associated helicase Cas3' [Pelotomaculum schinkii]TEB05978.1 CRISPR-associated endonuclease/helicase Cas3 [Pelotomaculum schinkii]
MVFYAKSDGKTTIEMHTRDLLNHLSRFLSCYPAAFVNIDSRIAAAIKVAALYHDLGKINTRFQNSMYKTALLPDLLKAAYKENQLEQIPHGVLSLAFMDIQELNRMFGEAITKAIRLAVCYHHDRKLVYEFKNYKTLIYEVIEKDLTRNVKELDFTLLEYLVPVKSGILRMPEPERISAEQWLIYAIIKGMLNRLDYAASSGLEENTFEIKHNDGGTNLPKQIRARFAQEFKADLNQVQRYMLNNRDKNLVVRASTGIGKTEGALLWIGEDKGFYTLPLKVSINAIYDRIASDYNYKNVRLLHSDALTRYIDQSDKDGDTDPMVLYSQSRLFSSPLTVCTVDQLFPFVFKHNGGEQLIATLAYSRVVIDEIQMYSSDIVAALVCGLKLIQDAGGRFAVITATMPAIITNLMKNEGIDFTLSESFFPESPARHFMRLYDGEIDLEAIKRDGKDKKVLVIVNTVGKAQELYRQLKGENARLLHSLFIKRHRKMLEEAIMNFSKYDEKGIWITTQLVEASLDIDFDVLYTEMCTGDSLLQRLGRCNRRGRTVPEKPNVFVFNTKNGRQTGSNKGIYDRVLYDVSWEMLKPYADRLFEEKEKFAYVDSIYDENKNKQLIDSGYYKDIVRKLEVLKNIKPFDKSKERVQNEFREILSVTLMPDAVYEQLGVADKLDEWQARLKKDSGLANHDKIKLKSDIQDYTVSVSLSYRNDRRVDKGAVEIIYQNSGIFRSMNEYEFDEESLLGVGFVKGKFKPDNSL